MFNKSLLALSLLTAVNAQGDTFSDIKALALNNGFKPSDRIVKAIVHASKTYNVNPLDLTAIGLIETGLGKYNTKHLNHNGSIDEGIFQINTINKSYCIEYNLSSPEGSSLCAAKLLNRIKKHYKQDEKALGRYHSNTPKFKRIYFEKITQVLANKTE